jgi:hypothetical protein
MGNSKTVLTPDQAFEVLMPLNVAVHQLQFTLKSPGVIDKLGFYLKIELIVELQRTTNFFNYVQTVEWTREDLEKEMTPVFTKISRLSTLVDALLTV